MQPNGMKLCTMVELYVPTCPFPFWWRYLKTPLNAGVKKGARVDIFCLSDKAFFYMVQGRGIQSMTEITPVKELSNKKLSCRGEAARCFVSLNILLSHSRSLEITPFDRSHTSSYWRSTSGPILYHLRNIKRYICRKTRFLDAPLWSFRQNICNHVWYGNMEWIPDGKKFGDSRFDTVPACDRQTDRQTDRWTDRHLATA